jgi:hypothetical protein
MSELFNIYIDNLNIIFNKISKLLSTLGNLKTGISESNYLEKFDLTCKDLDINMKEAERMLKQMDLEITMNSKDKAGNLKTFNTYKKRLEEYRSNYFKCKEDYIYTKKMKEMIVTNETERQNSSDSHLIQKQATVLESQEMVDRSNENLQRAKHCVLEIENTSKNVMRELEKQTGEMKNIGGKVGELSGALNTSNTLITRMMSRENRNKALLGVFSVTLVTLFVLILYTKV